MLTMLFLVGCSSNSKSNTIKRLSSNMSLIESSLNKIDTIDNSKLIVNDFMNEDDLGYCTIKINAENPLLEEYFNKITNLNNTIAKTLEINNVIKISKMNIISKAQQIKTICEQLKLEDIKLSKDKLKTLDEINNSISSQISRIKLGKNEISNNVSNIEKIKGQYSTKTEQVDVRYKNLQASLNTRLSYYNNLINQLDDIIYVINDQEFCLDEEVCSTTSSDLNQTNVKVERKSKFEKNIDTYENAGRRHEDISYSGNYGYNTYPTMPYGGYYGGMYPGGMYGYGMPYGIGYGFPNINTYRGIRNIDTYRKPVIRQNPSQEDEMSDKTIESDYKLEKQSNNDNGDETFVMIYPKVAKRPKIERLEK